MITLSSSVQLQAASVTLAWDQVSESAGYVIYWGDSSGRYNVVTNVGNVLTTTLSGLKDGVTNYIAVTAYDNAGQESDFSNEVFRFEPLPQRKLDVRLAGTSSEGIVTILQLGGKGIEVGSTPLARSYPQNAVVVLIARSALGGTTFSKWQRGGVDLTTNLSTTVTMTSDQSLTAVYTGDALMGDWKFEEGGGTSANDSSGLGNHGMVFGSPAWTQGPCSSGALSFDGHDDYVSVRDQGPPAFPGEKFTVALWVRTTHNGAQALVEKQNSRLAATLLLAINHDSVVPGGFSVHNGAGTWLDSKFRRVTDGGWHHLAVTYDGSLFRLYSDGQLDTTALLPATYDAAAYPLNFGRIQTANIGWPFRGQMDGIRLYNRSLSAAEVSALLGCAAPSLIASGLRLSLSDRHLDGRLGIAVQFNDETPVNQQTLQRVWIIASSNIGSPNSEWSKLNENPVLTNGVALWPLPGQHPQRFFRLWEQP